MEKNIVMPRLRPEMEKGVLCAWLKEEGEPVSAGEPLFEIETDKVVNQIEATQDGVLKKQKGVLHSTKHEGQGIGLVSIHTTVQKYHGNLTVETENNVFRANVLLNL